jgi:hypothetical protein
VIGHDDVHFIGDGRGQIAILDLASFEDGCSHFEGLEAGVPQEASLGVDDADFDAVGGARVRLYSATISCYSGASSQESRAKPGAWPMSMTTVREPFVSPLRCETALPAGVLGRCFSGRSGG